jgi:hypothetical protein
MICSPAAHRVGKSEASWESDERAHRRSRHGRRVVHRNLQKRRRDPGDGGREPGELPQRDASGVLFAIRVAAGSAMVYSPAAEQGE